MEPAATPRSEGSQASAESLRANSPEVLAQEKPEAVGQTYLIADEKYYKLNDLVKEVARVLNVDVKVTHIPFWPVWVVAGLVELGSKIINISPPIFRRRVDWFRQNRAFDISKAKRELGYEAKVDLYTGLSETAVWYRENGYL